MSRQEQRTDREQQLDDQEELAAQQTASTAAIQQAAEQHRENRTRFVEELRDLGIDGRDARKIADEFGIETAGVYAVANEDADDYRRHKWLNRNKRERHKARRNPGYLAERHPAFVELATGANCRPDEAAESPLTARERAQVSEVFEAKTALHSLGRGSKGLEALTEIKAVTEHRRETDAEEDDSGGLASRITGGLLG